MKSSSMLFLGLVCLAVLAGSTNAQVTLLTEDFGLAAGNMPPSGWTAIQILGTVGTEEWRFDNPGARTVPNNMVAPFATYDSDTLSASGSMEEAELISPAFDASAVGSVILQFDSQHYMYLSNSINVDVFDGTNWNNVYSTGSSVPSALAFGAPDSELTSLDVTAAAGGAGNARMRFAWRNGSWDFWWHVDNLMIFEPPPTPDFGVSAILAPSPGAGATLCAPFSNNETVQIQVQNFGFVTIPSGTMIGVQHDVDGANFVNETLVTATTLSLGQTENYTFTTGADLTVGPGPYTVTCTTTTADANAANDGTSIVVAPAGGASPTPLPFNEDFGTLADTTGTAAPAGWINDQTENDNLDVSDSWHYSTGGTSSGVGPPTDATTGVVGAGSFAFVEDSLSVNTDESDIWLWSPCLDLTAAAGPVLSFEVWSNDSFASPNTLNVDIVETPGNIVTPAILSIGDLATPSWVNQSTSLAAFAGKIIRVRFDGSNDALPADFGHDMAIDDVIVFDPVPSMGQFATPGFGTLDVNGNARNGANLPVSSGAQGAFYVTLSVSAGHVLGLQIGGEPGGMPSILFFGHLLEGGVPISGFGTIDLDPVDPFLGIFGNGFAAPPTLIDTFFFTDGSGEINLTFPTTSVFLSISPVAFSAINLTPTNPMGAVTITNTTEVTIVP